MRICSSAHVDIQGLVACRELTLPIAAHLGIPKENVFANRMNWQVCSVVALRCMGLGPLCLTNCARLQAQG